MVIALVTAGQDIGSFIDENNTFSNGLINDVNN